jgi:serine/threonine-protein kinase RsbW
VSAIDPPEALRLVMASSAAEIPKMLASVLDATAGAGLVSEQKDNLSLALVEALANAIRHGNHEHSELPVSVTVRMKPGVSTEVEVSDQGPGFDVSAVADPTLPDRLLTPGGRGIFMMRRLVDRVEFGPTGNTVRLIVDVNPSSSGAPPTSRLA